MNRNQRCEILSLPRAEALSEARILEMLGTLSITSNTNIRSFWPLIRTYASHVEVRRVRGQVRALVGIGHGIEIGGRVADYRAGRLESFWCSVCPTAPCVHVAALALAVVWERDPGQQILPNPNGPFLPSPESPPGPKGRLEFALHGKDQAAHHPESSLSIFIRLISPKTGRLLKAKAAPRTLDGLSARIGSLSLSTIRLLRRLEQRGALRRRKSKSVRDTRAQKHEDALLGSEIGAELLNQDHLTLDGVPLSTSMEPWSPVFKVLYDPKWVM